jgi:16S rRNA (cytidine1402-2'-O)-methyltransferase
MALYVTATPIGNPLDLTLRAKEIFSKCNTIIGEEFSEVSKLLKANGFVGKKLEVLNEHTTTEDLTLLVDLCKKQDVALVTDCGTPGFCDPGFQLVRECRKFGLEIKALPGASSLMTLLSLSSQRIYQFHFRGFLPAENVARQKELKIISSSKEALILMDTPYRLKKLLSELSLVLPKRLALLGCDLTQPTEFVIEDQIENLTKKLNQEKAEFILLIYPQLYPQQHSEQKK